MNSTFGITSKMEECLFPPWENDTTEDFFFSSGRSVSEGSLYPPRVVFTHERSEGGNWDPRQDFSSRYLKFFFWPFLAFFCWKWAGGVERPISGSKNWWDIFSRWRKKTWSRHRKLPLEWKKWVSKQRLRSRKSLGNRIPADDDAHDVVGYYSAKIAFVFTIWQCHSLLLLLRATSTTQFLSL